MSSITKTIKVKNVSSLLLPMKSVKKENPTNLFYRVNIQKKIAKRTNESILILKSRKNPKFIWKDFCDATSFVGLKFIGGNKPAKRVIWWIWCTLWLSQFLLCGWLSSKLFVQYLQYDIKTSTTYNNVNQLPFPAITICNQNTFRRSRAGGSMIFMYYIASFFAKSKEEMMDMMSENNETCYTEPDSDVLLKVIAASSQSLVNLMKLVSTDSRTDVMKCWWNSSEITCDGIFLNHVTDYSWCYTFNPDQLMVDKGSGYGLDAQQNVSRKVINAGPQNGLRLLLNVNQKDYCGVYHKYNGAGFYVQVHDPAVETSFLSTKYILLSPGLNYDVSLTPVTFNRKTEHLGKCLRSKYLSLYPNAKSYYQLSCYMQRMTEGVWKTCNCFPFTFLGQFHLLASNFGLKIEDVPNRFCQTEGIVCMRNWIDNALNQKHEDSFPSCVVPCIETDYDYEVSSTKFAPKTTAKVLNKKMHSLQNGSRKEKNYVQVNFYFDSMNSILVEEYQGITAVDLVIEFGWVMSLFLGISFITPSEILYYVVLYVLEKIKESKHCNQVRKY